MPGRRHRLPGTYEIGEDGGVEITLIGQLPRADFSPIDILWGEVQGIPVTCERAVPSWYAGTGNRHDRHRLHIDTAYEGARLRSPRTTLFSAAGATITNLEAFHRRSIIGHIDGGYATNDGGITDIPVGPGTVSFWAGARQRRTASPETLSITAVHSVRVKPIQPLTYDQMLQSFLRPLSSLVSLSGLTAESLSAVTLHRRDSGSKASWPIQVRRHLSARGERELRFWEMLLHTENLAIESQLAGWFKFWNRCTMAFSSFEESLASRDVASRLLYATGACEELHATLRPDREIPTAAQTERLERVLATIATGKDRRWARNILKRGHLPSLQTRLEDLAGALDADFGLALLGPHKPWAAQVADVRNALAHSDARATEYLQDPDLMYELTNTLQVLFTMNVLPELGFTPPSAAEAFKAVPTLAWRLGGYPAAVQTRA
ncbi:hypothetical protein OHA18_41445 [Kribbella sp. NBC_00709]|uniref:HEPN domain-containing protein n=1 Tax=Kribbella sp. NBC_00709 TaxID=2975972 RepID=UPI002E27B27D|nr:HEPN domain-containing protein [Kribbella sp. NBC_00709]